MSHSFIIGTVSLAHIALASLAVGFIVLAPITEHMGRRNPVYLDVAYAMTRFTVITFTASAVLALMMVELFIGWFPLLNAWLFNQFRYPLFVAMAAFLLLLILLLPYYHFWHRLRAISVMLHIGMGATAACLVLVWVGVLDGMGSYMLTPVKTDGLWAEVFNPTWIPLVIHRFFGNLLFAGFAMAGFAGWRLSWAHPEQDPSYYLALMKFGCGLGIGCLVIQPISGFVYASHIQQSAPQAIDQLLDGFGQAWLYLQFGLIAILFVCSHWILRGLHSELRWSGVGKGLSLFLAILMVAFATEPLPRRIITAMIVILTLRYLLAASRVFRSGQPPSLNQPFIRGLSMALGITGLLTYLTMGTIRETVRGPSQVPERITLESTALLPHTTGNDQ